MLKVSRIGRLICGVALFVMLGAMADGAALESARQALAAAGRQGGLVVHLGCGDGELVAALAAGERFLIHGLEADTDEVRRARERLRKLGVYGRVTVERLTGERLPYVDNSVNLLVAEELGGVSREEALRVLAPGGMLLTGGGGWQTTVKPWPGDIDEWTHYQHDASGNAVSHDRVVGPPGRLQWTAGPPHTRSHEHLPGIQALVSAQGRIFYIVDEGAVGSLREAARWRLAARDAFNGVLLWKQSIDAWFPHIVSWTQGPRQLQRKLVAVGDRVYVTLGLHAPLSAVDAATGKVVKVYENTAGAEEVLWHQGTLLLLIRSVTDERVEELTKWEKLVLQDKSPLDDRDTAEPLLKRLRATEAQGAKSLLALDAASGRVRWTLTGAALSGYRTNTLSAAGERVFFQRGSEVVCVGLETGDVDWSMAAPPPRMVVGDSVFCASGDKLMALAVESGRKRWEQPTVMTQVKDVFVAGGSLWVGGFKPIANKRSPAWGAYYVTERDLATGEQLRHLEPENPGHHHRCYDNKATDRYILGGRRGTEFIDLKSGEVLWNSWARGVCQYGVMPSNGLLYTPPHACGCYPAAKLMGFNALAPRRAKGEEGRVKDERLERGLAFGTIKNEELKMKNGAGWSTYRGDGGRSGVTTAAVPTALRSRWEVAPGGKLSAPTVGGGKVFVAAVEEQRVFALDAESGKTLWDFTAGGRVDSPPTLYRDRAIFGCRDGWVYCLRASDGALVWRLQAAGAERRVVASGQLESILPVHGSVLVRDDAVYFTAGRSSYMDGGIDLYRVAPDTGKVLSRTAIHSPDPETGRQPPQSAPAVMPGARMDLLSSGGGEVYLRDLAFKANGEKQQELRPHLFTVTGFLDDSWPHRSYMIFGERLSLATGCSGRDRNLIYGRLLVFDGSAIYGYGREGVHWSNQLQDGAYRMFAVKRGETKPHWSKPAPLQARALVLADQVLFAAGAGGEANAPGLLVAMSIADGAVLSQRPLGARPIFDGLAAAGGRLYVTLENGRIACLAK